MSVSSVLLRSALILAIAADFATASAAPLTPLDAAARALNEPMPPFRIADEIYYVGTADLGIFLIKTGAGDILLDSGYEETVPQILSNLRTIGVAPKAIRILLNSQAHYDHAGGYAVLSGITGAKLIASPVAAAELARGGRSDPNYGDRFLFPPVMADGTVKDGGTVTLGSVTLTAHFTPGHTKGCTTWTMPAHIAGKTYGALFLCGVTAPGYKLVGNGAYPGIVADYKYSFAVLRRLPCEIFLGAHGTYFDMKRKRKAMLETGSSTAFVDPAGCRRYLDQAEAGLQAGVAKQSAK